MYACEIDNKSGSIKNGKGKTASVCGAGRRKNTF
jgi:hypothetical protein